MTESKTKFGGLVYDEEKILAKELKKLRRGIKLIEAMMNEKMK